MSDAKLQFRVGLFVIITVVLAGGLVFRFGDMRWLWEPRYTVVLNFDEAPGVQPGIPVRKNGITIGRVREVFFDEEQGGVTVLVEIISRHQLRKDTQARLSLSLLGDATIEFTAGQSPELLKQGTRLKGSLPADPLRLVERLETKVGMTLDAFAETSREWTLVARNVNQLVDTNRGQLDQVIEQAAESMHQFSLTMRHANQLLGDPQNQQNLRETLAALPAMIRDTRAAIVAVRSAVETAESNLKNLNAVTQPLAKHSESIVSKLDGSAGNLELLLAELNQFARLLSSEEGSLRMLVSDPSLYRNLNRSASSLDILLRSVQPIAQDLRILSDKLARHPELLGVGGALRGSSGLKTSEEAEAPRTQQPPVTEFPRGLPRR